MEILIGSDHAGYDYKTKIKQYLIDQGHKVHDVGTDSEESSDYPEFAHHVAEKIQRNPEYRGILVCGSGVGMSIAANRYPGIRATLCMNGAMARKSRQHNDANCLILGQRITEYDEAQEAVDGFIEADFDGGRHQRRINKIDDPPLRVIGHPLVQKKLTHLRNRETENKKFRELVGELAGLMFYEVTETCPTVETEVETPLETAKGWEIPQDIVLVPIMRAGLGMVDSILQLVPTAKVGHVGLYRDEETLEPVEYYMKLPEDVENPEMTVVDPMLATGGSAAKAIELVKEEGHTDNIRFLCLVASPEGIENVHDQHPDVSIYTASIDKHLDDEGYIIPGLGDAGDRLFGTQ